MKPDAGPRPVVSILLRYTLPLSFLCCVVYWQALTTWFHMDDFAWLGLRLDAANDGLLRTLFGPRAQGTVRVLSERVFFLGMTSMFGMNYIPFKAVTLITECANLTLIAVIARRLTKSELAVWAAALAYVFNSALYMPMAWLSAYNELLWTLVLLLAFYFLTRYVETGLARYNALQWTVFLLGFGVLESSVVYPAIASLYAWLFARRFLTRVLPLFIPSIIFTIVHFTLIPKSSDPLYALRFNPAVFLRFGKYLGWALGPSRLGHLVSPALLWAGFAIASLVAIGVAVFSLGQGGRLAIFLMGWFAFVIAPVLPLENHVMHYYIAPAIIGPAILAGWAFARAWAQPRLKAAASILLAAYCVGNYAQTRALGNWAYHNSQRLRSILGQIDEAYRHSPRKLLLLSGLDRDLFLIGLSDEPLRLYGIRDVYLKPGSESELAGEPLRGIGRYTISAAEAARAAQAGDVLALSAVGDRVHDVTAAFTAVANANLTAGEALSVNVGLPSSEASLGDGWFPIENVFRWMGPRAIVHLDAPRDRGRKLVVSCYYPAVIAAAGPVRLRLAANGHGLGTTWLERADTPLDYEFPLPRELVNGPPLEIEITVDRATKLADGRTVGLIFGTFAIK